MAVRCHRVYLPQDAQLIIVYPRWAVFDFFRLKGVVKSSICYTSSSKVSFALFNLSDSQLTVSSVTSYLKFPGRGQATRCSIWSFVIASVVTFVTLGSANSSPTLKLWLINCTLYVAYASISVSRGFPCMLLFHVTCKESVAY